MSPGGFGGFDRISVTGVRAFGYHGVLPEERRDGQEFVVDVVLHADVGEAGHTDRLESTLDYSHIAMVVVDCIQGEPVKLLEALAQRIADQIFEFFDSAAAQGNSARVSMVEVTVHKPSAPIPVPVDDVAVAIVRVR